MNQGSGSANRVRASSADLPGHRLPVDITDRAALRAYRPAAPDVIAIAERLKEAALVDFVLEHSTIAAWIYSKCPYQIPTTAIETAAVMATGDGACMLLYNPDFFCAIGLDDVKFVLFHEARHVVQRHLFTELELRGDPVFTLATECTINHVALLRLRRSAVPERDGEKIGVDPREIHRRYEEDLREQGVKPFGYDAFIATDLACYSELKRMTDPPTPPAVCSHLALDGELLDPETVERVVSEVLANVQISSQRGVRVSVDELTDLVARTDGATARLDRLWSDLGASTVRGRTHRTRRIDWWQRWLVDVLASKLSEGQRLVYPKKRGAILAALGGEPMLSRRGPEREKVIAIAIDASGSMPDSVVEWLTSLVGQLDAVDVHWLSFDADVAPFDPGGAIAGGGGTSFQAVADYLEGRTVLGGVGGGAGDGVGGGGDRRFDENLDAVVMVTDGYAPRIRPEEPDKWIWLITEQGDDWPERQSPPMACHRVRTGEL